MLVALALVASLTALVGLAPSADAADAPRTPEPPRTAYRPGAVGPQRGVSCPRPSVRLRPGRNIQAAIDAKPQGTTFCLLAGIHRLRAPLLPKSRDVFVGQSGAILRGSKVVKEWRRRGRYWVASEQRQQGEVVTGVPCGPGIACNRPEGVFIGRRPLLQVTELARLRPGTFYFDYTNDEIFLVSDPRGRRVEASIAAGAFQSTHHLAENVVIRNLVIEMFATPSRAGTIRNSVSPGWVVAHNEVALNHAGGISHHDGARIEANFIHHNGQVGLAGFHSSGAVVIGNEIAWNAIGGFTGGEAGGAKYVGTRNLTLRKNYIHHNKHHGLWTDTDNRGTLYEGNTIVANKGSGIYHEKSFDCLIRDNVVARNGGDGILIDSSSNVEAFGNRVRANKTRGIHLSGGSANYPLAENVIRGNTIAMRDGTVTGLSTADVDATGNGNRFVDNAYVVHDPSLRYWVWAGASKTWSEWRDAGQDVNGSVRRA